MRLMATPSGRKPASSIESAPIAAPHAPSSSGVTVVAAPQAAVAPLPMGMPSGDALVLIVTGATIAAEMRDRPLAYRLREKMLAWVDREAAEAAKRLASAGTSDNAERPRLQPVVCSDLWYLNARELSGRPAVAIGEPTCNAATALISNRLPTVFVIEGSLRVHADVEFIDLRAALWAVSAAATASAIDLFAERYLDGFMRSIA